MMNPKTHPTQTGSLPRHNSDATSEQPSMASKQPASNFATTLIDWQQEHGRHQLPWQGNRDPYRVWLSEVMLQQTQVATVCDYFRRFVTRFPDVASLAQASLDDVLALWSGLGYYSRARHLHRCAQQVQQQHGGVFPADAKTLQSLSGIGPSSAAAIAALCFGQRVAIFDGNVQRVLTRFLGFDADLSHRVNQRALQQQAQHLLPEQNLTYSMPRYTQAIMDLGAIVCQAKKPHCSACPLHHSCVAKAQSRQHSLPVKSRKIRRTMQTIWLLWAQSDTGAVWLAQRPTPGVWAGLYCLPWFDNESSLRASIAPGRQRQLQDQDPIQHTLTHKDLCLRPLRLLLATNQTPGASNVPGGWVAADRWPKLGLPAPIRKLLETTAQRQALDGA